MVYRHGVMAKLHGSGVMVKCDELREGSCFTLNCHGLVMESEHSINTLIEFVPRWWKTCPWARGFVHFMFKADVVAFSDTV